MDEEILITKILNQVPCGFPSPAMDYMQERISLDKTYIKHPLSTAPAGVTAATLTNFKRQLMTTLLLCPAPKLPVQKGSQAASR